MAKIFFRYTTLGNLLKINTILAITSTNLLNKNGQTPPEVDSDQEPPKTPHALCRRPSERR